MRHQFAITAKNGILGYYSTRIICKSTVVQYNSSSPIMAIASSEYIFVERMIWSCCVKRIMFSSVYLIFINKIRELLVVDSQDCVGSEMFTPDVLV